MHRVVVLLAILGTTAVAQTPPAPPDPLPHTVEEFQAAAARVLDETGVPGAGIALVHQNGIVWEGGVGYADRDRRTPVTADTRFRVGSISKTFVALALVQLSEDGLLSLDDPVYEILPDLDIDNPWYDTDPVRVIHLLEHTAGFDDMHFNEMYMPPGQQERSLEEVLQINPRSRRVRWPPGTRMSYSNPGYAVAGRVIEEIAEQPYDEYIAREIFEPLGMMSSSFRLTAREEAMLAQGYSGPSGPAVGFRRIYLRPAGNLHSSAHDMGRFVQMLLGWGELDDAFVVDPEYLGNMEQPRTTLASRAGLRNGYGSGIATMLDLPFPLLGHGGGIDGFLSQYAYSPARDVGFVILLNSIGGRAGEAMERLSSLAIRFLKRDVEPAATPEIALDAATLERYVGYYHDANPRNQFAWPVQTLFSGRTIVRDGDRLYAQPMIGERTRLVPVTDTKFRLDHELDASRVFTIDADGTMVMTGGSLYMERRPRWRIELVRVPVLASLPLIASVFLVAIVWVARLRRAQPRGFWELKLALLLCPLAVLTPAAGLALTPMSDWGMANAGTTAVFVGSLALPALALIVSALTVNAIREGASRLLVTYSALIALAMGGLSLYLSSYDMLGVRLWLY